MKHAFDEKTGEYIGDIIDRLKSYVVMCEAKFNELSEKYNTELSKEDELKIESYISGMQQIVVQAESKNRYSLSGEESDLISKSNKFEEEIKLLNNKYFLESIKNKVTALLKECDYLIPQNAKIIAGEIIAINKKIEILREKLKALSGMINTPQASRLAEENITDLTNKFEEYSNEYADLEKEIKKLVEKPEENTQSVVDEQERQTKAVMLKTYSEQIKPALSAIETHKENTSVDKKGILERIITDIKQLEDEVKLSIKDAIQDKVSSIVSYINENYNNLATPRGLFAHVGMSGRLVQDLKSSLDGFMLAISQIQTLSLEASPALKP